MNTIDTLHIEIRRLADEDLRKIIQFAIAEHKKRIAEKSREKALLLLRTSKVKFIGTTSSKLPYGIEGVILKINFRTAVVDFDEKGNRWRVDVSLLEPVT